MSGSKAEEFVGESLPRATDATLVSLTIADLGTSSTVLSWWVTGPISSLLVDILEMTQQSKTKSCLGLEEWDLQSAVDAPKSFRGSGRTYTGPHVASFSTNHMAQQRSSPTPRHITYWICPVARFCLAWITPCQPPRVPSAQGACLSRGGAPATRAYESRAPPSEA
jgi:hypothetical protein